MRVCVHVSVLLCVICNNVHVRAHSPAAELLNSAGTCACACTQPSGRVAQLCRCMCVHTAHRQRILRNSAGACVCMCMPVALPACTCLKHCHQ